MEKFYGRITGWGSYVPEKVVTNHDIEKIVETNHDWIVQRTGIHQRHVAADHETTASLGTEASKRALAKAGISASELDLILLATNTIDHLVTPPTSSLIQHELGAEFVPAMTIMTGCTGFVYALVTAQQFISSGAYKNILIIGSEILTRHLDWTDRSTCVLFGDAAGAFIMQATTEPCGINGFDMGSDGGGAEHLIIPGGGTAEPINATTYNERRHYIYMNGREVFKFATRVLGKSSLRALALSNLTMEDVDWIVPHQANFRIIQAAARGLRVSLDKFLVIIHNYGNISTASIPLAICEALDEGKVKLDDQLLLTSFGAGLTWASCTLQMAPKQKPVAEIKYINGSTAVPA